MPWGTENIDILGTFLPEKDPINLVANRKPPLVPVEGVGQGRP
jgi:hypothetical protein